MLGPSDTLAPLRWRLIDGLHVCYADAEVPVPEELWDQCMASRTSPEVIGCLSIVGGDGFAQISRRQWLVSATITIQRQLPLAMISSHRMMLAMVQAAGWSGANIRAFRWAELDLALAFLGVAPERYASVREVAEQLRDASDPEHEHEQLSEQAEAQAQPRAQAQGSGGIWQDAPK